MIRTAFLFLLLLSLLGISIFSCDTNPYKQGKILYEQNCMNCHQPDGQALRGLIPPLAGSDYLQQHREKIACIIRYGMDSTILVNSIPYNQPMPGNDFLTETQITNILNYINNAWGNDFGYIPYEEAEAALKACEKERIRR